MGITRSTYWLCRWHSSVYHRKTPVRDIVIIALSVSFAILVIKTVIAIRSYVLDTEAYFFVDDIDGRYQKKQIDQIIVHLHDYNPHQQVIGDYEKGFLIYDESVNDWLKSNDIQIKIDKAYKLPKNLQPLLPFVLITKLKQKKTFVNDKKIALASDLLVGTKAISLMKSTYYDGELTNELGFKRIRSRRHYYYYFDGVSLFLEKDDSYQIKPYSNNYLANRMGVSTLAITRDDYVIIRIQGKNNIQNADKFVPTGSGSMDYADLKGCSTLNELIIKSAERELNEESSAGKIIDKTLVLAFAKLLTRGAKPEFFCITYLNVNKDELLDEFARSNKENDEEVGLVKGLRPVHISEFKQYLTVNDDNVSIQLLFYLTLLEENNVIKGA